MTPSFVFTVCQPGSEPALKDEIARREPALRFAFSRPGFVTFRIADDAGRGDGFELHSTFARTWGFSLGKAAAADAAERARTFWHAARDGLGRDRLARAAALHVWERERALPGDDGFDGAGDARALEAGEAILAAGKASTLRVNADARAGDTVLDCVIVEPHEWWLGWHRARAPQTRWPGGVPALAPPEPPISRAYYKLEEALRWSVLPVRSGDRCIEVGRAPGGACQALLDRGCVVVGVDPAEMDARVLANPRFTHVRARTKDAARTVFEDARWLTADINTAPKYTLDTVEAIVAAPRTRFEGLVLTLKLTDAKLAAEVPRFAERVRSWGYARVRARQLAFNRQEVCVVAAGRGG
jgi:23S rRNA (cytidine2498-2'-O)-methyltransferase